MIELPEIRFSVFHSIIVAVLLLSWLYQIYFYSRYLTVILRLKKAERKGKVTYASSYPPVSVVICARDETDLLAKMLPLVLQQDYPQFEVIVVNNGASEETDNLLRAFKKTNPHLKSTFVPQGTTNLSTKKLALSLGIKAASYDWLLFTDADCMPQSNTWIQSMARNFVNGTEIVLGYGPYQLQQGWLSRIITYDTLFTALKYLSFAKAGKPFMGVGRNMAYNKAVYVRNNGFTSNLHLQSGEDDLFVNRASNRSNTRVECSPDSITVAEPVASLRAWLYQKQRHLYVVAHYSTRSKLSISFEPVTRFLFYGTMIASLIVFALYYHWIFLLLPVLLAIIRYAVQVIVINKSSGVFSERRYFLDLIFFDLYLPLVSLYLKLFGKLRKKVRYSP